MSDDIAVVTGAAGALGRTVVKTLAARGDRVLAVTRHGRADDLAPDSGGGSKLRVEAADLAVPEQVDALWERFDERGDRPRWLVNAAGGFRAGTVAGSDADRYQFLQDLNLGTAWWSCRAAADRLPAGGGIVNVAARSALSGGAGSAAYAISKAAVLRLTTVLATELVDRRVRVNAVLPSVLDTPANRGVMSADAMRHAVPTADLADVVAFLCSDAARAVTGAAIPVSGWSP